MVHAVMKKNGFRLKKPETILFIMSTSEGYLTNLRVLPSAATAM